MDGLLHIDDAINELISLLKQGKSDRSPYDLSLRNLDEQYLVRKFNVQGTQQLLIDNKITNQQLELYKINFLRFIVMPHGSFVDGVY